MPPKRSAAARIIAPTSVSSATSTSNANASPEQRAPGSSAAARFTSAAQTRAPSEVKSTAASRPIPPPAPVITQTLPSSRPISRSALRRVEDVLHFRVPVEPVQATLPAEAGLLEAAERRRDAHRAVRVDAQHAGLECARDPEGARAVLRPDRAGEAVRRVVRDPDRVRLVLERDQRGNRPEDLLACDAIVVRRLDERARVPEAFAVRRIAAEERFGRHEARDRLTVLLRDER